MGGQRPGLRDPDISGLDLYTFFLAKKNEKNIKITCIYLYYFFREKKTRTCLILTQIKHKKL